MEAASLFSRSRHESEFKGALNSTRAAHSCLNITQARRRYIHEGTLHKLVPFAGRVETQRRTIRHQVCHFLTLRQLEHLGLIVAESAG